MIPIELLGWISTIVTLTSFLFHGVRMRVINSMGAMGWMLWGYYTNSHSVVFLNFTIMLIHLIMITRLQRKKGLEEERRRRYFDL